MTNEGASMAGEVGAATRDAAFNDVPHSLQNLSAASYGAPHPGQANANGCPHSRQNFPPRLSAPQLGQAMIPLTDWACGMDYPVISSGFADLATRGYFDMEAGIPAMAPV